MNEDTFACDDVPEEPKVQTIAEVPQKMAQHVVGRISCVFFPILLLLVIYCDINSFYYYYWCCVANEIFHYCSIIAKSC